MYDSKIYRAKIVSYEKQSKKTQNSTIHLSQVTRRQITANWRLLYQGSSFCSRSSMFWSYDYWSPGTLIRDKSTSPRKELIPLILPTPPRCSLISHLHSNTTRWFRDQFPDPTQHAFTQSEGSGTKGVVLSPFSCSILNLCESKNCCATMNCVLIQKFTFTAVHPLDAYSVYLWWNQNLSWIILQTGQH